VTDVLTAPAPSGVGETRQCVCGGWTRFVVCQYCATTDPAAVAAGMISTAPLTAPSLDIPLLEVPAQAPPPPGESVPAPQLPAVPAEGETWEPPPYDGFDVLDPDPALTTTAAEITSFELAPVEIAAVEIVPVEIVPAHASGPVPVAFAAPIPGWSALPVAVPLTPDVRPVAARPVPAPVERAEAAGDRSHGRGRWLLPTAAAVTACAVGAGWYLTHAGTPAAAAPPAASGLLAAAPAGWAPLGTVRPVTPAQLAAAGLPTAPVRTGTQALARSTGGRATVRGITLTFATPGDAAAYAARVAGTGSGTAARAVATSGATVVVLGETSPAGATDLPALRAWAARVAR